MHIIDTYDRIPACYPGGLFSMAAWRDYAGCISPNLPAMCEEDADSYDFSTMVVPVLANLAAHPEKAQQAHTAFVQHVDGLDARMQQSLGATVDATILLYLGLCCAAGWATELDGRPAVLLGLEKIVELDWCSNHAIAALIDHELGHLWHFQHRTAPEFADRALWQLYTEGMAMLAEQRLQGDPHYFHQNKNGWLTWCEANRKALFSEYLRRVQAGASVQDFFGDWCQYQGHADVGYYLGSVVLQRLSQQQPLPALINLTQEAFLAALQQEVTPEG